MEFAFNNNDEVISALTADYGLYFCTECGNVCGLRKPIEKASHFYHLVYNPKCSLSVSGNPISSLVSDSQLKVMEAVETICKNTTKENWFQAIKYLLEHFKIQMLNGINFAIKPVILYLNSGTEIPGSKNYFELINVLMNTDSQEGFNAVKKILFSEINELPTTHNIVLLKALLRNYEITPDDLIDFIKDNNLFPNIIQEIFIGKIVKFRYSKFASAFEKKQVDNWSQLRYFRINYKELIEIDKMIYEVLQKKFSKEEWLYFYTEIPNVIKKYYWDDEDFSQYCRLKAATF